jgi:hypothetical protein
VPPGKFWYRFEISAEKQKTEHASKNKNKKTGHALQFIAIGRPAVVVSSGYRHEGLQCRASSPGEDGIADRAREFS